MSFRYDNAHLTEMANQLFAAIDPVLAHRVRTRVTYNPDAMTAMTDGLGMVVMPKSFCNKDVESDPVLQVGLLLHELGHFLQPLDELSALHQTMNIPMDIIFFLADINAETTVETLFSPAKYSLTHGRMAVKQHMTSDLKNALKNAQTPLEAVSLMLALMRCKNPTRPVELPFSYDVWHQNGCYARTLSNREASLVWNFVREISDKLSCFIHPKLLPDVLKIIFAKHAVLFPQNDHAAEQPQPKGSGKGEGESGQGQNGSNGSDDSADKEADPGNSGNSQDDDPEEQKEDGSGSGKEDKEEQDEESGKKEGKSDSKKEGESDSEGEGDTKSQTSEQNSQNGDDPSSGAGYTINPFQKVRSRKPDNEAYEEMMEEFSVQKHIGDSTVANISLSYRPYDQEAILLSRGISPRFAAPKSASTIFAPGRVNRREAAYMELPFEMDIPGGDSEGVHVIIALDVSGSMDDIAKVTENQGRYLKVRKSKVDIAKIAVQAIKIAVEQNMGKVTTIAFADEAIESEHISVASSYELSRAGSGTNFKFLEHVWRSWPYSPVIVVTDGWGQEPAGYTKHRDRTSCIVIPNGRPQEVEKWANRVVMLESLMKLQEVVAAAIPRRSVS